MYLDYTHYQELGGKLEPVAYHSKYYRAASVLDAITHGRVRNEDPVRPAVQYAIFAMIEAQAANGTDGHAVQSYSNDGVSVTYAVKDDHTRMVDIAMDYLRYETTRDGVALLYAGVDA